MGLLVGRLRPVLGAGLCEGLPRADARHPGAVHTVARLRRDLDLAGRSDRMTAETFLPVLVAQAEMSGVLTLVMLSNLAPDTRRESAQVVRRNAARTVPPVTLVVSRVTSAPTLLIIAVGLCRGAAVDHGSVLGG